MLKQTSHFYFQRRKKIRAKDNLSISIINSVPLSWHAFEADRPVMSITFASTVTAPEGSWWKQEKCVNGNWEQPLGNNRLTWDCPAFQNTSCYIILYTYFSAHIILDPASLFEVPFPILNSLLIHFGSSN